MKLIAKISRLFLLSWLCVSVTLCVGLYYIISSEITHEVDEQLFAIVHKVTNSIKQNEPIPNFSPYIEIKSVAPAPLSTNLQSVELRVPGTHDREIEPFRQIISTTEIDGKYYQITARISLFEKEDLISSLFLYILSALFILGVILLYMSNYTSKRILHDFFSTLKQLEDFSLHDQQLLVLPNSEIDEFSKLNQTLNILAARVLKDYRFLKEFSEELNHEIRTPIAVIKSKLELLLQEVTSDEKKLALVDTALKNLQRLERINKSILLLNNLENGKSFEIDHVRLGNEIQTQLDYFHDVIKAKNITVTSTMSNTVELKINYQLAGLLITNMLTNAIKHNSGAGIINIQLANNCLEISNSGKNPRTDSSKFFERFYKESDSFDSVGLGLSIVEKICQMYSIQKSYSYSNGIHTLLLRFPEQLVETNR